MMPGGPDGGPSHGDEAPAEFDPASGEEIPHGSSTNRGETVDGASGGLEGDENLILDEEAQLGPEDARQVGRAIASIGAVVVAGAIGVGIWVNSQDGSEASTPEEAAATTVIEDAETSEPDLTTDASLPVDPSTSPRMGWSWLLRGRASVGHKDLATQYDAYIIASLDWVDGQSRDELRPKYEVNHARVFFPSVNQAELGTGCTNTGEQSDVLIFQDAFVTSDHAGFLQFDLTSDPITYKAQLITHNLSRPITHTCPETTSVVDYGSPITWVQTAEVDNSLGGQFRTDYIEFFGTYQIGDAGFTSHFWVMTSCDEVDCVDMDLDGDNLGVLPIIVTEEEISWVGVDANDS